MISLIRAHTKSTISPGPGNNDLSSMLINRQVTILLGNGRINIKKTIKNETTADESKKINYYGKS